jgi:hypothetical protein
MAVADHFDTVQKIYIAFYQRPADPAGLRYWAERVEVAGGDTATVINAFANSEEATALYGDITEENIGETITAIYQALFGRAPDAAGLAYYEEAFANGELSAGTIALQILDGASGEDTIAISNKLEVANEFTQQVDGRELDDASFGRGSNFAVTYDAEDVTAAREILAGVTASPATVLDESGVRGALLDQIANEGDPIQAPGQGEVFTLTTAAGEIVNGTASDNTFNAILGTGATINDFDAINGGAGRDTLNILSSGAVALPTTASVSNVEVVNFQFTGAPTASIDAEAFAGAQEIWQRGSNDANVVNLGAGQIAGFRGTDGNVLVSYQDDVEAASIAVDGVTPAAGVSTFDVSGADLTTVSVSGSLAGEDPTLSLGAPTSAGTDYVATENIETLNLALTTDATVELTGALEDSLVTVDTTASTGGITIDLSDFAALETVTTGAGNDNVTLGGQEAVTVDTGAGNDIVTVNGAGVSVTTGAGNDTVNLTGDASGASVTTGEGSDRVTIEVLSNVAAGEDADLEESFEDSIIQITDFNGANAGDVLALSVFGERATLDNNAVNEINTAESLFDALEVVAGATTGWTTFQYDGSTYVFQNDAVEGFGAGDGLVELVGFTGALNGTNFLIADDTTV